MAESKETRVARWDPFAELGLRDPWAALPRFGALSRWMEEAFGEPVLRGAGISAPIVDITESDQRYLISAEVPGVKKGDLTLEIHEGVLTLRGEKKEEREETKDKARRLERRYGAFSRSFTLPSDADSSKIDASFADGVLKISIPKRPEAKPAQVSIKG
jgi:HSP20 family protein